MIQMSVTPQTISNTAEVPRYSHLSQTFTRVTSRPARCSRGATFFSYKFRPLL